MEGGAAISFLLLTLLSRTVNGETDPAASTLLDRHEAQLARLESLLDSLSRTVSRLESAVANPPRPSSDPPPPPPASATPASSGPVPVTKFKPSWPEKFQIAAAAQLGSPATAAAALPHDGPRKFFAAGAGGGGIFLFSAAGDLLGEIPPPSPPSSVTALLFSASPRRNATVLFAGHADGSVFAHRLGDSAALAGTKTFFAGDGADPVISFGVFAVGRGRFIAAGDGGGKVRIFDDGGALRGAVTAASRPLAFSRHRPLFLTETGAGSLDLRAMAVKETLCQGLNGTRAAAYAFDVAERSKAFGITADRDLVQISLLGDVASIKCRVRASKKVELSGIAIGLETIRGYLIAVDTEKISVFNISLGLYGRTVSPQLLFSSNLEELGFGQAAGVPAIAGDWDKALLLGSSNGFVGIYRSSLPVYKVESGSVLWSSPVLVFLIFLVGIWHFYAKKRDVLGWIPEDMEPPGFTAAMTGGEGAPVMGSPTRRYVSSTSSGRYADVGFRSSGEIKYRAAQRMETTSAAAFAKRREAIVDDDHVD